METLTETKTSLNVQIADVGLVSELGPVGRPDVYYSVAGCAMNASNRKKTKQHLSVLNENFLKGNLSLLTNFAGFGSSSSSSRERERERERGLDLSGSG